MPPTVDDALRAHRERVAEVLPSGDPAAIKGLYVELGDLLQHAAAGDSGAIPALSFPETAPVITSLATRLKGRILDAGCGPNPVFSLVLGQDASRTVVGLDISTSIVKLAVARARALGVDLLGVVADLEALPFLDRSFDGCLCEDTVEHLPNDRAGISELARVLTPEGRLILGTPNRIRIDVVRRRLSDRRQGVRLPSSSYYAASSHLREYTWADLETLVRSCFVVRGRSSVGWTGGWKARVASRLISTWPFRLVGRMIILVLQPKSTGSVARSS